MSGHGHEEEHALEEEDLRPGSAPDDQDADPSLNAPGDADPSGVERSDEKPPEGQP